MGLSEAFGCTYTWSFDVGTSQPLTALLQAVRSLPSWKGRGLTAKGLMPRSLRKGLRNLSKVFREDYVWGLLFRVVGECWGVLRTVPLCALPRSPLSNSLQNAAVLSKFFELGFWTLFFSSSLLLSRQDSEGPELRSFKLQFELRS